MNNKKRNNNKKQCTNNETYSKENNKGDIKSKFASLVIKTIDTYSIDDNRKLTNLKLDEQIFRNFFRITYINCVLQKKKYINVISTIGTKKYKEYVIAKSNKIYNDLQYIFEIKNSGFINIDKFIAERNNIDLINKRKSKGQVTNNGKYSIQLYKSLLFI